MAERTDLRHEFLDTAGWGPAKASEMAGDASARRYLRLRHADGRSAVLMDAPPENAQDVRPFLKVRAFLGRQGLSVPQILAEDTELGFLLLEDFGDGVFSRLIETDPNRETMLYEAAVDMLAALVRVPPPPWLMRLSAHHLAAMTDPCFDWYAAGVGRPSSDRDRQGLQAFLETCLIQAAPGGGAVSLRDCHAENLMWLPDREGIARVGLLDFQDAVAVHPAYDLVSLLQDARRDVSGEVADAMIDRYASVGEWNPDDLGAAVAVLGLQRNLRILGIFARLAIQDGKARYLSMMPRVWGHIERNLDHPAMSAVARRIHDAFPAPTPDVLERLTDHAAA